MNTCYVVRSSRPAGFGLERLATAFMNTPGDPNSHQAACLIKMHLYLVAVCGFSKNCACAQASPRGWKVVHVNRKQFGTESNLIYRIESNRPADGVH
jgi:hypothetical protein